MDAKKCEFKKDIFVRRPGVEPGSTAWKATMLTATPPTQYKHLGLVIVHLGVPSFVASGERMGHNKLCCKHSSVEPEGSLV